MSFGKNCAHILIKFISLPTPMCLQMTASFCSIYPQYLLFLSFSILFLWIKLSPYQHQCCTVVFDRFILLHKSPIFIVFYTFYFSMIFWWFVCIPNGMTAEPKSHGRPTNSNWQITRKSWRNMDKNSKYCGFMELNEAIKDADAKLPWWYKTINWPTVKVLSRTSL